MLSRRVTKHSKASGAVLHIAAGVEDYGWSIGEQVLVMPQSELDALVEEARAEGSYDEGFAHGNEAGARDSMDDIRELEVKLREAQPEVPKGFDAGAVSQLQFAIHGVVGDLPSFWSSLRGVWRCGFFGKSEGLQWCNKHHIDAGASGDTLEAAGHAMLAAVTAAVAEKPCPCKDPKWSPEANCWKWPLSADLAAAPQRVCGYANRPCPDCGRVLPPKPAEHMTIEECAEECPPHYYADNDKHGWRIYDKMVRPVPTAVLPWPNYHARCVAAWRAVVRNLREGA